MSAPDVPVILAEDLRVEDSAGHPLVCGVDLRLHAGETMAIVGESGSGKSLTARSLVGLLPAGLRARGRVAISGVDLAGASARRLRELRGAHAALLFQDPFGMLNPRRRVGALVADCLAPGLDGGRRQDEVVRRLAEVGIDDPAVARRYPFELSGGLRQRVAIAAALARDPEVLIADEPTTALDVTTQRVVLDLLSELRDARGMGLILITHDLRVAFETCRQVAVMYCGRLVESGTAAEVRGRPLHPYTSGLLRCEPPLDRRVAALDVIPGAVARPEEVRDRCCFAERCAYRQPACEAAQPALVAVGGERARAVACVRAGELHLPSQGGGDEVGTAAPSPGPALLRVEQLTKTFAARGGTTTAVRGVSFSVAPGEAVAIVGESGSGKTTVARCVAGLERATSGSVAFGVPDGQRPAQLVFQDPYSSLNPAWTVGASIREALRARADAVADPEAEVAAALRRVGMDPSLARRKPAGLSGGQRQRIAIARALAARPPLLICDEPVSALDVSVQAQVLNVLNDIRRELGTTLLVITHDLAVARQVADRILVMHRGVIVEEGGAETVLSAPDQDYTRQLLASALIAPTPSQPVTEGAS